MCQRAGGHQKDQEAAGYQGHHCLHVQTLTDTQTRQWVLSKNVVVVGSGAVVSVVVDRGQAVVGRSGGCGRITTGVRRGFMLGL